MNIEKLLQDEALGNMGRKAWLAQPLGHPQGELLMMLSGSTKTIDRLLEVIKKIRRQSLDKRKELRRLNRKLKDRQLGASIYKEAVIVLSHGIDSVGPHETAPRTGPVPVARSG